MSKTKLIFTLIPDPGVEVNILAIQRAVTWLEQFNDGEDWFEGLILHLPNEVSIDTSCWMAQYVMPGLIRPGALQRAANEFAARVQAHVSGGILHILGVYESHQVFLAVIRISTTSPPPITQS